MYADILRGVISLPLQVIALWDESKVVRAPAGTEHGGEFAPKGGELRTLQGKIQTEALSHTPAGDPLRGVITSAVENAVRKKTVQDLQQRLTGHPAFAQMSPSDLTRFINEKIELWEGTSGDSEPGAIQMQWAVKQEFTLNSPTDHMNHDEPGVSERLRQKTELQQCRAFVRAEYERTQAWFKEQGITHVTVVRGMPNPDFLDEGTHTIRMQPASSWTTSVDTAYGFSSDPDSELEPMVLVARVPVDEVLSLAITGRGSLREDEVILLGHEQQAWVFNARHKHTMLRHVKDLLQ